MEQLIEVAILLVILLVLSIVLYKKKSLNFEGTVLAVIVGLIVYLLGGFYHFIVLLAFLILGDLATRFRHKRKPKKHETRGIGNIVGNAGAGIGALLMGSNIAFFGAISSALSDTFSSEIGILSKKKPKLITNFETVERGTEGAISLLGEIFALLGALIIGIAYLVFAFSWMGLIIVLIAGFAGQTIDSFLGAIFEQRKLLNNTLVNLISCSLGAIIAFLLFNLLM